MRHGRAEGEEAMRMPTFIDRTGLGAGDQGAGERRVEGQRVEGQRVAGQRASGQRASGWRAAGREGGGTGPHSRDGRALERVAFAAVFTALAFAIPLGANRPVSWSALSICLTALLAAAILAAPAERRGAAAALWPAALLWLAALAWGLAQSVPGAGAWAHPAWALLGGQGLGTVSADPAAGPPLAARLAAYAALFWIVAAAAAREAAAHVMLRMIAVFSTALAAYGILAAAGGVNPVLGLDGGRAVVSATFVNRNSYATYAAFGALANVAAFIRCFGRAPQTGDLRDTIERIYGGAWIYALGALICAAALAGSQSRAGAAAGLIGATAFAIAWRRRGGGVALAAAPVVVAALFAAATSADGLMRRLLGAATEDGRFIVYPRVLDAIADRPWLGHGLGAFEDVFRAYVPLEAAVGEWDKAHSSYLENVFELGLPAAAAFYAALALIAARIVGGVARRRRDRIYPCLALACLAAGGFHAVFDFSLQMPAAAALFAALLGLGWAQSARERPQARDHGASHPGAGSSRSTVSTPEW